MVQTFGVFSEDGHVHHARLPNLAEFAVDFVWNSFVEFDGTDVGVQIQSASQTENDRATRQVAVRQPCTGISNGTKEYRIGFVLAEVE